MCNGQKYCIFLLEVFPNTHQIQGEDGGWKLEERELEEKRRSLEGQKDGQREMQKESPRNESFEKREDGTSPRSGEKPPQVPLKCISFLLSSSIPPNSHIL